MSISDEDIIRRRLLIEGDSVGDDRRITTFLKTLMRWCSAPADSLTADENRDTSHKLLTMLNQVEHTMERTRLVQAMNTEDQQHYEVINEEIEQSISKTVEKISSLKLELTKAKTVRKNRQEYDTLAKIVQQHPPREQTQKQLEAVNEELEQLQTIDDSLTHKLDMRKKQFYVLLMSLRDLQTTLEDEEEWNISSLYPVNDASGSAAPTTTVTNMEGVECIEIN